MKSPDRNSVSRLDELPNIGNAGMADLIFIGITNPKELIGKDAYDLYDTLCQKSGAKHDPCVIDVFLSAIDYMEGGEAKPWWAFTPERKKIMGAK